MKIYTISDIKEAINPERDLVAMIRTQRQAFIDFSAGNIILPLPIQLKFENPTGDCHIKAGFKKHDDIFIIKVATGFYQNSEQGLPSGDGVVLVFQRDTGVLKAILCDGGYLTTLRTAIAALVVSKIMSFQRIGIIGTGNLGQLVAKLMKQKHPAAEISIWGRDKEKGRNIADNMDLVLSNSLEESIGKGGLIITTTASRVPMIYDYHIKEPTHIIALGSDEKGKQEIDVSVLGAADRIIVDSKAQSMKFGDSSYALHSGLIDINKLEELGVVLKSKVMMSNKLIVTDLTGLAAQDIAIARMMI